MRLQRLAPAKVNLYLHVGPVGADGYHPLASLVTFADVGDVLALEDADAMSLSVSGPFADEVGAEDDNLVVRARRGVEAALRPYWRPFRLTLDKRLPVASGLGGGSADAAAAMRLMNERWGLTPDPADERVIVGVARRLGADVPMCLVSAPRLALGRGDELAPPPAFPALDAVLVNPLAASPTGPVYRRFDASGAPSDAIPIAPGAPLRTARDVAHYLATCRNDLEAPAVALQPAIGEVLAVLTAQPQTLFARMSGSGATCFALCETADAASDLAAAVAADHPHWWIRACRLAGWPDAAPQQP
jgi:4-diphosphocytidyl-2-C-methyl-D-erythritol kinase